MLVHREPSTLVVTPRPAAGAIQLPVRAVRRVTASRRRPTRRPSPRRGVAWEVGDTAIIAYDAAKGELTGRALGTTTLTARLYGFDPVVWTVQVIPGTLGLDRRRVGIGLGERDSLRAVLLDEDGKPLGAASELEWSSDPAAGGAGVAGRRHRRAPSRAGGRHRGGALGQDAPPPTCSSWRTSSSRPTGAADSGIYQIRSAVADTLQPVLADSFGNIQPRCRPTAPGSPSAPIAAGSYDLYLMDADGGNPRRLTTDPGNEGEPIWTPDGSRIVYTATPKGGQPQLHALRPDGNPAQALTAGPGGNHSPTVSADGRTAGLRLHPRRQSGDLPDAGWRR